jgi:short-subunit dehydrogenase
MGDGNRRAKTALITGGSVGIGREMARVLAGKGMNLVLVARREERLRMLAEELGSQYGVSVMTIARDLGVQCAATGLFAELTAKGTQIDLLINNAGFGLQGSFAGTDPATQLQLLEVNVVNLTHLTRLLLPGMIERKWGRILNVASIGGFVPGPLTATYSASKAYVISFSEALAVELRGTGVTATVLCPGPTDTEFAQRAGLIGSRAFRSAMGARKVADVACAAMLAGKRVVIPGWVNKLRMMSIRCAPRMVLAKFSGIYHRVG